MSESDREINNKEMDSKEINNKAEGGSASKYLPECQRIIKEDPDLAAILWSNAIENSLEDSLTGLYNRRYMDRILNKEIETRKREVRSGKEFTPFILIVFDLDNLKAVNDGKKVLKEEGSKDSGHDIGDEYLKTMAKSISGDVSTPIKQKLL